MPRTLGARATERNGADHPRSQATVMVRNRHLHVEHPALRIAAGAIALIRPSKSSAATAST